MSERRRRRPKTQDEVVDPGDAEEERSAEGLQVFPPPALQNKSLREFNLPPEKHLETDL